MALLSFFREGQVYEVLLTTRSNVTPVGTVREGHVLKFRLFEGESYHDLLRDRHASIQVSNSAALIVSLALNDFSGIEVENAGPYRWIKSLPGLYGTAACTEGSWKDAIGESKVLNCTFFPEGEIEGRLPPIPFSRADCLLVEMAVDFTRVRLARGRERERLLKRFTENFRLYTRLGGNEMVARRMASELGLPEEFEKIQ
ncbi:DUF447 domain-containing protein [Thermococcus sp.]|uniref:DUF447 domain-containing protein n=1 Tax=Thermococcus sp. TaxID=35749 RepID=UPI00262C62D6|nr:DUF447 domain-containing protein [Thermococcus sp.]